MSSKMSKISFDFDNTIAMSYMTYDGEQPKPVFQSYNDKIIKKIKKHIKNGDDIYIVTARTRSLEVHFPEQTVEYHLDKLLKTCYTINTQQLKLYNITYTIL